MHVPHPCATQPMTSLTISRHTHTHKHTHTYTKQQFSAAVSASSYLLPVLTLPTSVPRLAQMYTHTHAHTHAHAHTHTRAHTHTHPHPPPACNTHAHTHPPTHPTHRRPASGIVSPDPIHQRLKIVTLQYKRLDSGVVRLGDVDRFAVIRGGNAERGAESEVICAELGEHTHAHIRLPIYKHARTHTHEAAVLCGREREFVPAASAHSAHQCTETGPAALQPQAHSHLQHPHEGLWAKLWAVSLCV